MSIITLIKALPKAELHLHIEGSLSPALMWELAQKHNISMSYNSVEEIEKAYQFSDLQSFLDLYYAGADVLRDENDFYRLMKDYLDACEKDNIVHTEIMFDPQTHTQRGVGFNVFMPGFLRAIREAQEARGMSVKLIMSFLRHLTEADAIETLRHAEPWYDNIHAIGLDSSELDHPPEKFERAFSLAREAGFKLVAHAGEEGPPDYIWQAINLLNVDRIDHGVRCQEDEELMSLIKHRKIPLTVCPLSNLKLCVIDDMADHNILSLLDAGLMVTVNSDDPTYFGGFLNDNFIALHDALELSHGQCAQLVKNSFEASFLSDDEKARWCNDVDEILAQIASPD